MIVLLAREPTQTVDDQKMDSAPVRTTELQQPLQLGAIGRLRALALFLEAFENFEALALAVVFAGYQLRGKAQILGLAWIRHTDINHSSDHVSQLSPFSLRDKIIRARIRYD